MSHPLLKSALAECVDATQLLESKWERYCHTVNAAEFQGEELAEATGRKILALTEDISELVVMARKWAEAAKGLAAKAD